MRVAYLLADPGIGVFGTKGASVHVQEVVRALRAHGHEVTVYCAKRGDRQGRPETESVPADLADLDVVVVPVTRAKGAAEREQETARAAAQLAARAAEDASSGEPFGMVYERYSLFSDAGARLTAALRAQASRPSAGAAPLVLEVNAPLVDEQRAHRALHDAEAAEAATLRMMTAADLITCVSEPVAAWVRSTLRSTSASSAARAAAERVAVIPNGVNTSRIRPTDRDPDSPFTVGFVGTLKPWHGTETLLRAFASAAHPERESWRLELVGRGPEQQRLQELAEELGISGRTVFHGAVPPAEVPDLLGRFDVAVAPYPAPEREGRSSRSEHYFSPLKVYEYLAAGLAVVASAVGELPGVLSGTSTSRSQRISDRERGLLVPPGDDAALANALDQLAAHPELRRRLSDAGRAAVVERHTWIRRTGDLLRMLDLPEGSAEPDAGRRGTPPPLPAAASAELSPGPSRGTAAGQRPAQTAAGPYVPRHAQHGPPRSSPSAGASARADAAHHTAEVL